MGFLHLLLNVTFDLVLRVERKREEKEGGSTGKEVVW